MPDKTTIDHATLAAPKPPNWVIVILPLIMAAGPVALAFFGFSLGYGGMAISALALLSGFLLSPAAAILAVINGLRFRKNPAALTFSLFAVLFAASALFFEIWRMNGEWD